MAQGRQLTEPAGYGVVTFVSTVMIVAGIGLAWWGLLLAAAGLVLSVIEFKELQRLNDWLTPQNLAESPLMAGAPRRIGWMSLFTTLLGAAAALGAAQKTGEPITVVGPAAIAGVTALIFNAQMRRALEAGKAKPSADLDADD